MEKQNEKTPFYRKNWFVILMIIFLFPIGLILMWMQTNWKKSVKWVVTVVVLLIAFTAGTGDDDTSTAGNNSSEDATVETVDESTEEKESEEPSEEEIAEQEEKKRAEKEQAEKEAEEKRLAEEQKAKEEKDKKEKEQAEKEKAEAEKEAENFQHEVIEGVDTYTFVSGTSWSANSMMTNFSVDATRLLKDVHQDLTNGAVFRIATTLTDGYGNESQDIVSTVWYSQETVEKINYDNWPRLDGEDLYNTADGVIVHYAIGNDVEVENKSAGDNAPEFYRYSIGAEYEE